MGNSGSSASSSSGLQEQVSDKEQNPGGPGKRQPFEIGDDPDK